MDKTIQELTVMVKKFCEERDWDQFHNPKDLAIGISTEANELLDIFRFKSDEDMKLIFSDTSSSCQTIRLLLGLMLLHIMIPSHMTSY